MMEFWLPIFFTGAMGLALLIYVILDGYDLGIGILLPFADEDEKDIMIASIGPFWDANETWLVLGIGILLFAFPQAHGLILSYLYLPVAVMIIGLILRGVAFDFRVKAVPRQKTLWNNLFSAGSLAATLAQGWMLGSYITGLTPGVVSTAFASLIALTLPALYIMLGAAWVMIKTEGGLQRKALYWARQSILPMGLTLMFISIATPLVSVTIAEKWFSLPAFLYLLPIPLTTLTAYLYILRLLLLNPAPPNQAAGKIFVCLIIICLMAAAGLSWSIFPDIVMGRLTIWDAAASTDSLLFIFWGVAVTLPTICGYTVFVYRIFHGKASQLKYDSE